MVFYTGTFDTTYAAGNFNVATSLGCDYYARRCRPSRRPQKKNPFVLLGYTPDVILKQGRPAKKKESFKKASQVVISRVGIVE